MNELVNLSKKEMDHICENEKLQKILFEAATRWMAALVIYADQSSEEFPPSVAASLNNFVLSIEDRESPENLLKQYGSLLNAAQISGVDLMDIPLHWFARSFH